jgi:hypothetical protein
MPKGRRPTAGGRSVDPRVSPRRHTGHTSPISLLTSTSTPLPISYRYHYHTIALYPAIYLEGFLGLGIHPDHRTISPPYQAGYIILQATSPPFRSICLSIFLCFINQTSQTFYQATTMADVHLASLPRLLPCTTYTTQPQSSQSRRPIMTTSTNVALANLQPRQTHRSRSISSSTNSTPRISTSNRSTPYLRPSPTSRRRNRHLLLRQPTLSRQPSPALDTLIDSLEQSRLNTQSRTQQRARPFPPRPPTAATPAITLISTDITTTTIKPTIKSKDKMASTSTSMHAGPSSSQGQVRVKQEEGHVRVKQEEGCEASSSTQHQRQSQSQAQTQRIDERPRYKDPYHGHEETAKMSARFVSIMLFSITWKSPRSLISIVRSADHLALQLSRDTSPDWT